VIFSVALCPLAGLNFIMLSAARWIVVLSLMVSIGLHTVVIQSTAWAGMLVEYTLKTGSVSQAVADTFDGEHGCPMCQLAQKTAQDTTDDPSAPATGAKLKTHLIADAVPVIPIIALPRPTFPASAGVRGTRRASTPDSPPPRIFTA
jgi:hypothetical protein